MKVNRFLDQIDPLAITVTKCLRYWHMKVLKGLGNKKYLNTYLFILFILFNQVSDLQLQWQLNQSIAQSEVGLKQSAGLLKNKPPIIISEIDLEN